jgi:hypothetical protein
MVSKKYQSPSGGLNGAGRKHFHVKPPIAHPKGPTGEARKKSFCARMCGCPGPKHDEHGDLTRKGLALKKWGCSCK